MPPNGDRVFLFNHTGHLILSRLTPNGYEERGRFLLVEPTAGYRAQDPVTWAHPAYANKRVFARNDRELVYASLAAGKIDEAVEPAESMAPRVLTCFERNAAQGLAFSPDGKSLTVATRQERLVLNGHSDAVWSVAFAADGTTVASASADRTVRLWDAMTGKERAQLRVRLWEVATGKERLSLRGHRSGISAVALSPDNRTVASGGMDDPVRL